MSENRLPKEQETEKTLPIIMAILGVLYGVSPLDILPDVVPIGGQLDDLVITGGSLLNLAQAYVSDSSKTMASIIGMFKWILLILGGILIVLVGLFGLAIYKIFS